MRRREFIAGLSSAATWPFARPLAAEGQRHVGALQSAPKISPPWTRFGMDWQHSAGSKALTCGSIIASPAIPAISLRMRRN
jgi:hypothetical protein